MWGTTLSVQIEGAQVSKSNLAGAVQNIGTKQKSPLYCNAMCPQRHAMALQCISSRLNDPDMETLDTRQAPGNSDPVPHSVT